MTAIPLCQIAMSVTDLPRTHAWYTAAFGFVPSSGTNAFKGYLAEKVQGVPGARSTCWWLGDQQEFFQLELFQFERPRTRLLPVDWRPCDIGYSLFGLHVRDFVQTLVRLEALGTAPLTAPMGEPGERRVCVRDPEGVLIELFEADPGGVNRFLPNAGADVLTVSVTLSVPDLSQSLGFFRDVLGLQEVLDIRLHEPEHEALWGLAGSSSERALLRAGDTLVEIVQYTDPIGKPPPADYRVSDQGLLNIALGFRSKAMFDLVHQRCLDAGIKGNWRPLNMGAWNVVYVNDAQGFSVELLQVQPWYDRMMGFTHQSRSPGMSVSGRRNVTLETAFDVPADVLWKQLSEHEGMTRWWPQKTVTLVKAGESDRNGVGAVRRMQGLGATLEEEVTGWYSGTGYDYRLVSGAPLREHRGFVRILPRDDGCLLQWRVEFRPLIPGTGAASQWCLRKLFEHAVGKLKQVCNG